MCSSTNHGSFVLSFSLDACSSCVDVALSFVFETTLTFRERELGRGTILVSPPPPRFPAKSELVS